MSNSDSNNDVIKNTVFWIADDAFCFVDREFYKKHKGLDINEPDICDLLPDGFRNSMESMWEYNDGSIEEGRQKILALGFEEVENPWS